MTEHKSPENNSPLFATKNMDITDTYSATHGFIEN